MKILGRSKTLLQLFCAFAAFIIKYEEARERFLKWMNDVRTKLDNKVAQMKEGQRQREWES